MRTCLKRNLFEGFVTGRCSASFKREACVAMVQYGVRLQTCAKPTALEVDNSLYPLYFSFVSLTSAPLRVVCVLWVALRACRRACHAR
jgi:hypothetical protein